MTLRTKTRSWRYGICFTLRTTTLQKCSRSSQNIWHWFCTFRRVCSSPNRCSLQERESYSWLHSNVDKLSAAFNLSWTNNQTAIFSRFMSQHYSFRHIVIKLGALGSQSSLSSNQGVNRCYKNSQIITWVWKLNVPKLTTKTTENQQVEKIGERVPSTKAERRYPPWDFGVS